MSDLPPSASLVDDETQRKYEIGKCSTTMTAARHQSASGRLRSRIRIIPAILIVIGLWMVFRSSFVSNHRYSPGKGLTAMESSGVAAPVPLEAHIMSKCPDAKACLNDLVVPAMARVSNKVNFTLSYIGTVDPESDEVACMHGPSECLGNIIQLCAAKEYPDPKIYLGFANCLTTDYARIPDRDLVTSCALEHGVDFQKVNACISSEDDGVSLLRSSVERSRHNNVTKSCTVRLNNKVRCIRDGGKWYDCPGGSSVDDLVRDIEHLYNNN